MGGLGTASPVTSEMKIGIVSMIAVMAFGFSIGWGPLTYVVSTELPALRLRDKTLRVGFVVNVVLKYVHISYRSSLMQCANLIKNW